MSKFKDFSVKVEHQVSADDVSSLLCSAFEGGSNYWAKIKKRVCTGLKDPLLLTKLPASEFVLVDGCSIIFTTREGDEHDGKTEWWLDRVAIERGLALMAAKWPGRWAQLVGGGADANTGDVFLQLCLFQDVIYG